MGVRDAVKEKVLEILKKVPYPGFSRDIVSFGKVKDVHVEGESVTIELVFAPQEGEDIRERILASIREALSSSGLRIGNLKFSFTEYQPPGMFVPQPKPIPGVKHIIAVASAKGGVGKSTVAVYLARAFQRRGHQVGFMDADIYGPSSLIMLNPEHEPWGKENRIIPGETKGMKMISIGFFLPSDDQAIIWRGPRVMKAISQFIWDVEWGQLDFLIIDLPPGTGDVQLTLLQELKMDGAVIVTTPQKVALIDARKGVTMFQKLNTRVLGILENMSSFQCPECGAVHELFGRGGGKAAAEELGVPFLGEIPLDPRVRTFADQGLTLIEKDESARTSQAFMDIAGRIEDILSSET